MFIVLLIVILTVSLGLLGALLERKDWNKGKCPECGRDWRYFGSTSCGDRGYMCDNCRRAIWISWPVDRR